MYYASLDTLHSVPYSLWCFLWCQISPTYACSWTNSKDFIFPFNSIKCTLLLFKFQVMPENYAFGRRPPFPLCWKNIKIIVGKPIEFDLPKMKQMALSTSKYSSICIDGWPSTTPCGLDQAAQRHLYTTISEKIQTVMEQLRVLSKTHLKL